MFSTWMIDYRLDLAGKLASFFYKDIVLKVLLLTPLKIYLQSIHPDFFLLKVSATYFTFLAFINLLF